MLGDIIKKGHSLESRRVRTWKARCRVQTARKSVVDLLLLPQPSGDGAQMAVEAEQEQAQRDLEEAEYRYLCEREGCRDPLTRIRAQGRAASWALWALTRLQRWTPEPMHPILDMPMKWIFDIDDDEEFDPMDYDPRDDMTPGLDT